MRRTTPRLWLVLFAIVITASIVTLSAASASARPWLGVYTQEVTGDLRDGLGLHGDGVLVSRVVDDSPADRAGLRRGDVITRLNSRTVESPSALADMVGDGRSGQTIALEVLRDGERRTLSVTLSARPNDDESVAPPPPAPPAAPHAPDADDDDTPRDHARKDVRVRIVTPEGHGKPHVYRFDGDANAIPQDVHRMLRELHIDELPNVGGDGTHRIVVRTGRPRLGVRCEPLSGDLASALDVPGGEGVLVLGVNDDSPAQRAGLRAGDVILAVDGHGVKDVVGLQKSLGDAEGRVSLSVSRKGARRTIEADLGSASRDGREDDSLGPGRMEGLDRLMRLRDRDDASGDELREQVDELRRQVRELRQQLEEQRDHR